MLVAMNIRRPRCKDISEGSRSARIDTHAVEVNLDWWNRLLSDNPSVGGPLRGRINGRSTSSGSASIDRGDVFALADEASSDGNAALTMLWLSVAWGSGNRRRLCRKRVRGAAKKLKLGEELSEIASLARENPRTAYARMCPRSGGNLIKYLGPAFATKYLYFAGGGAPTHPSLILDSRVARALRDHCGWSDISPDEHWSADTYARYCTLLHEWALEMSSSLSRTVGGDEYERCLFDLGKP
jgi:hypothetical protein